MFAITLLAESPFRADCVVAIMLLVRCCQLTGGRIVISSQGSRPDTGNSFVDRTKFGRQPPRRRCRHQMRGTHRVTDGRHKKYDPCRDGGVIVGRDTATTATTAATYTGALRYLQYFYCFRAADSFTKRRISHRSPQTLRRSRSLLLQLSSATAAARPRYHLNGERASIRRRPQ